MSDTSCGNERSGGETRPPQPDKDFLIVGLGGSAGAIHAFREFFRHVPHASGMAYVVVLHLSPEYESHLAEVLQQATAMPVEQVRESISVEPDRVYVIPPNKGLTIRGRMLTLSHVTGYEERRAPVDIFFRTLAEEHHSRAVSITMSGMGANGSMGLKRIKERGGLVLAQEPSEAEFEEMPRNSIATGLVDYVLPASEMPAKIIAYRDQRGTIQIPVEANERAETDEQALIQIFTTLRLRTGHDFRNYKRATVLRRIERRMSVRELPDLPSYVRHLRQDREEAQALLKDLLVSVTNFFRDPVAFQALEEKLIPRLFDGKGAEHHVRVWVAGCATGEEAYSIAMLLAERAALLAFAPAIQVFATDIDEQAVSQARNGYYTLNDVADVSPARLRQFFIKENGGFRVRHELRETVLFAVHNLVKDPPFSHLDLVTCRNLLIYLNRAAQERTLEGLHFSLNPGGYLMLGTSESVEGASDLFMASDKEHHLYQGRTVMPRMRIPAAELSPLPRIERVAPAERQPPPAREQRTPERLTSLELHQRLLEFYGPPSVIVNEEYDIIHLSERAGRYLQIRGGEPSHNLLSVIRPELRLEVRAALLQAAQNRMSVEARSLVVHVDGRAETINMVVRPAPGERDPARGFFLVLFEEAPAADGAAAIAPSGAEISAAEPAARQLEEENVLLKARMRATVEQYETQAEEFKAANKELQAMNEELRSATEELETSKEELQSVNEELHTVNQELKIKIEELSQANDDMRNLMSSTEIATIFLDRSLRVKLFTPRARDVFNLIPTDVGRPLLDITSRLSDDQLRNDIESVVEHLRTIEREVETHEGHFYQMRLLPYRTAEDRIEGVVLTFVDVTSRKRAEEALRTNEERTRGLKEAFQAAVNGAAIEDSLNIVARIVIKETAGEARTAFYIADPEGTCLHPLRGAGDMPESYLEQVDGFAIGEDSLACGLAVPTGRPILTRDVFAEPLWKPWVYLAEEYDFRGCWSFPVKTRDNKAVGTFAMYFRTAREATPHDLALADVVTQAAAVIISSHTEARERARAEEALRESEARLAADLAGMRRLYELHTRVATETDLKVALDEILAAACELTGTDRGCVQLVSDDGERLEMYAWRGYTDDSPFVNHFRYAGLEQGCDVARVERRRQIIEDTTGFPGLEEGTEAGEAVLASGIRAAQSTPMISRKGETVGVLSTQFTEPHRPTEDELRLVDLLAWTAADFVERHRSAAELRASEERLRLVVETAEDYAIMLLDAEGRYTDWNRGAEKLFGYTEEEVKGQPADIIFTPEDRAAGVPLQELRAADREGRASDERWHVSKNGARFYVSGVMVSLRHGRGYAKIARDLTAQKQAQDELRRAWEELEERVQKRTAELASANSALQKEVGVRSRVEQERLELLRRLVEIQENERRRIARELHDQLGQQMTALRLKLESLAGQGNGAAELGTRINQAQALAAEIDSSVDFLAWEMRPAALDQLGVQAALQNFVQEWRSHFGVEVAFYSSGFDGKRLSPEVETNLYRILQEALQNVHKHAEAERVDVLLERRGDTVVMIVEDNGCGYDQRAARDSTKGMGVINMRERAALVGGTLEIESAPEGGTTIFVRVPFKAEPPEARDESDRRAS